VSFIYNPTEIRPGVWRAERNGVVRFGETEAKAIKACRLATAIDWPRRPNAKANHKPARLCEPKKRRASVVPRMRGEQHGRAKLTASDVIEARRLRATGVTYPDLGTRFGVSHNTVRQAVIGLTWTHITEAA
jgi:hypothetical protein